MSSTLRSAASRVTCRPRRSGRHLGIAVFGLGIPATNLESVCACVGEYFQNRDS